MTKTITEAELRNGSAGIMDSLEAGDDFVITRNGRPVGELRPIAVRRSITTTELETRLARFAGMPSGTQERAEIDEMFGEDRIDD